MPPLATIVLVVLPFVVSPGASLALTLGHVPLGGRRAVVAVLVGTAAGVATMVGVLVVTRLGEAVAASPVATAVTALAGGVVLAVIGGHMVVSAARAPAQDVAGGPSLHPARVAGQAYLALLLNPKALSVYLVVVPGLAVGSTPPLRLYVVFATVHVLLLGAWLLLVAWLLLHVPAVTRSARWRRGVGVAAGACLVLVGAATASGGMT